MLENVDISVKLRYKLPRGDSRKKRTGCSNYLLEVKRSVLVPLMVFSLISSTAGEFVVPFRV